MDTATATLCPGCQGEQLQSFFTLDRVPVLCNVFSDSSIDAVRVPRGDVELALCAECGLIHNLRFDPERLAYDASYENSMHFSQKFRAYADSLTDHLVKRQALEDVIEIGCGKGDFLAAIARKSGARCVGFDRSYAGEQDGRSGANLKIVRDEFDSLRYEQCEADLLVCRHVLEHVPTPLPFLVDLRRALRDGGRVYLEVPNTEFQLRRLGVWDVIYEHVAYYTEPSLRAVLEAAGFEVVHVGTSFGEQFLAAEARPAEACRETGRREGVDGIQELTRGFADAFVRKVVDWNDELVQRIADGERVAVWGAGSKGVTFLNVVSCGSQVAAVIDINERKQGKFVAGTAQRITPPERLRELAIDTVLVMNPNYRDEIEAQIRDLGARCEIRVV